MVSCASCGYSKTTNHILSGVSFHRFPKGEKRRKAWIEFMKNPEFVPKAASFLCSHHFTEDCFDRTSRIIVRLYRNAIPTIKVDRTKHDRNPVVTRPSREEDSSTGPDISSITGPSTMPVLFVGEQSPLSSVYRPSEGFQDTGLILKNIILPNDLENTEVISVQGYIPTKFESQRNIEKQISDTGEMPSGDHIVHVKEESSFSDECDHDQHSNDSGSFHVKDEDILEKCSEEHLQNFIIKSENNDLDDGSNTESNNVEFVAMNNLEEFMNEDGFNDYQWKTVKREYNDLESEDINRSYNVEMGNVKIEGVNIEDVKIEDVEIEDVKIEDEDVFEQSSDEIGVQNRETSVSSEDKDMIGPSKESDQEGIGVESELKTQINSKRKILKCPLCDYEISPGRTLREHIDTVHLMQHNCQFCAFTSNEDSDFKFHMYSEHPDVKIHECHLCDYVTTQKKYMKYHMESMHLKLKRHKCLLCDFAASQKQYLTKHVSSAHPIEFKCRQCVYTASDKQNLKAHVDSVHSYQFKCHLCSYEAYQHAAIVRHVNYIHKKLKL